MDPNQRAPETSENVPTELRQRFDELMRRRLYGRKTIQELHQWGDIGIRLLVEAGLSEDFDVREWAILVLERLADPKAIPLLITLLAHDVVRLDVANILKGFGAKAVQPLLDTLPHTAPQQRQGVLLALGTLGDTVATPHIIPELEHEDSGVRAFAAIALQELGDIRAVPALAARLADPDDGVWGRAVDALRAIGDPRAVPALITALQTDPDHDVRIDIIGALGELGDARAVEPLLSHLFVPNIEERASAAEALGDIGEPGAVDLLILALRDSEPDVRARAAEALGTIGDPRALEPLISFLSHPDQVLTSEEISVQAYAVLSLGRLDGEQMQAHLLRAVNLALQMDDDEACWAAVLGLRTHGDAQALPVLQQIATVPRETRMGDDVAEDAEEAIEEIVRRLDSASDPKTS